MDWLPIGNEIIRVTNAILWTIVVWQILYTDRPVPRLVRQLISFVILVGMWVFAFGGLTSFGVPGDMARVVYTAFATMAGAIAFAMLSVHAIGERRLDE